MYICFNLKQHTWLYLSHESEAEIKRPPCHLLQRHRYPPCFINCVKTLKLRLLAMGTVDNLLTTVYISAYIYNFFTFVTFAMIFACMSFEGK